MTKSKIEWLRDPTTGKAGFSINPVKGLCPVACSYCYARRFYKRFHWNPEIRFEPILSSQLPKKPSRIFVGSTMELFGSWVDAFWLDSIFKSVRDNPQHTFIFLTKYPARLPKEFPENCWVGASAVDYYSMFKAVCWLPEIKASVRFISFEPLLESVARPRLNLCDMSWLIIGQATPIKKATMPKIEWINEICQAANEVKIPVFLKENLRPLFDICAAQSGIGYRLRQEFPVSKPTG